MELAGRVVLVTGAARRLGRAIAERFAAEGARVVVHYRSSRQAARDVVRRLRELGAEAIPLRADLSRPGAPDRLLERIARTWAPVDVLVNSASVYRQTPLGRFQPRDWDEILATNLRAPALLSRRAGLAMKRRGEGAIVMLGDWSIPRPYPGFAAYAASKAGLEALTRLLAHELAPEVRVNMVSPGAILPPRGASAAKVAAMARACPLGRLGRPEEIAEAVLFLVQRATFTTGVNLLVDGGRSLR
jgi:pteridine reductase